MDESLAHYGILGMKWGVRRTPAELSRAREHVNTASGMVKEAKKINKSVNNIRSTTRKMDLSSMSDQELKERVNRLNMEQQYSTLVANKSASGKGQTYTMNTLEIAGSVLAISSSALGIALAIKQLRG